MKIMANGIELEVIDSGQTPGVGSACPVVLLIVGMGMQLTAWPAAMVQGLLDAGCRVIRYDNRDAGLSQHLNTLRSRHPFWLGLKAALGRPAPASYSLTDMARDALGLLDALHIGAAHVVGISMGGMIAQRLCLLAPHRVHSLTSIMSSSGAHGLSPVHPKVRLAMIRRLVLCSKTPVAKAVDWARAIGSPTFPPDEEALRSSVEKAIKRAYNPQGIARQLAAVLADGGRSTELQKVSAPTLVVHGTADPLLPLDYGEDTARRIPGATLLKVAGMGHNLPPGIVQRLLPPMLRHIHSSDAEEAAKMPLDARAPTRGKAYASMHI